MPIVRDGQASVQWEEGIVPGLDFCNHDPGAAVRWIVAGGMARTARPLSP
jgi:hypothetical protein